MLTRATHCITCSTRTSIDLLLLPMLMLLAIRTVARRMVGCRRQSAPLGLMLTARALRTMTVSIAHLRNEGNVWCCIALRFLHWNGITQTGQARQYGRNITSCFCNHVSTGEDERDGGSDGTGDGAGGGAGDGLSVVTPSRLWCEKRLCIAPLSRSKTSLDPIPFQDR